MAAPNPISSIAIEQFNSNVTTLYHSAGHLAGTTQEVHGIVGDAYNWPVEGHVDMSLRGSYGSIIPQSQFDHYFVTQTFEDYALLLALDRGEQTLTNVNERMQFAKKHTNSMGRRLDQWKIDAMINSGTTNLVVVGTTNLTEDKTLEAQYLLNAANCPMENRYLGIHASQLKSMLKQTKVTSIDYVNIKGLIEGTITRYNGFNVKIFGDSTVGGLPKTGDNRTVIAWQQDAVGCGMKEDGTVGVSWSEERRSWISVGSMIGNAKAILPAGIVLITCDETK